MMKHYILFLLLLSSPAVANDSDLSQCKLAVHVVTASGDLSARPILGPEHIASIVAQGNSPISPERRQWLVKLTADGSTINQAYSAAHVGSQIAFLCGEIEVSRPYITAPSSDEFVLY